MLELLITILIKPFEGLAKKLASGLIGPYICPAGFATQGYGLLVKDMSVEPVTPGEAEDRLKGALPYYVNWALKLSPSLVNATSGQQAAIVDFIFNLGPTAYKTSTLRKRVNEGDWEAACAELRKWVNGGGRKLPGLVARREAEILLIRR